MAKWPQVSLTVATCTASKQPMYISTILCAS